MESKQAMTKAMLLDRLRECQDMEDADDAHAKADDALIAYIGDPDVAETYYEITRWYS